MAERLEFREKLAGILTLCESQNNITDKATVEAYFAKATSKPVVRSKMQKTPKNRSDIPRKNRII